MIQHATFAAVFVAMYVAHMIGDHFLQTLKQALGKGARTRLGQALCARHVASLTGTKAMFLLTLELVTGLRLGIIVVIIGLSIDAGSHYMIDRRYTLAGFCEKIGKGEFYRLGAPREGRDDNPTLGTGAYALDQSAHIVFLFVASLIMSI